MTTASVRCKMSTSRRDSGFLLGLGPERRGAASQLSKASLYEERRQRYQPGAGAVTFIDGTRCTPGIRQQKHAAASGHA